MRLDLIAQIAQLLTPSITHETIARKLRILFRNDPLKGERAVGQMYGHAFRKAEEAYAARGFRTRQRWL